MEEITNDLYAAPRTSVLRFWLAWLGWNALGLLASALLRVYVMDWVTNTFLPQINAADLSGWVSLFIILCMAFAIAAAQFFFLRRYLPRPLNLSWLLATGLGWFLFYLGSQSGTYAAFIQSNLPDYATFAQAHAGELQFFSYLSGVGGGLLIGFFQWLVLRLYMNKSTSWLGWSALGWVAYELPVIVVGLTLNNMVQGGQISQETLANPVVLSLFKMIDFPLSLLLPLVSGIGLARLVARHAGAQAQPTEDFHRGQLLLRWTLWTAAALLVDRIYYGLGVSSAISNLITPATAEASSAINWGATAALTIEGIILGFAQVIALGREYRYRWAWLLATAGAFFLGGVGQQWPFMISALTWGRTQFTSSPGLFSTFIWLVLSDLPEMLGFAVFQTSALWQWAGKRAWMWILAGPAIYLAATLMGLLFGLATNIAFTAAAGAYMIVFLLRSGWVADVVLAPQGEPPSEEEMYAAAEILQARLSDSLNLVSQVLVEDGLLVASFTSENDAELAADVLLQKGGADLFEADSVLVVGQPTPRGKQALFGADDILEARSRSTGRSQKALLELTLSEEGAKKVEDLLSARPQALMALAVDGKVVMVFEPDSQATRLVIPGFDEVDASSLAGILNNDPLPFNVALAEEE